MSEENKETTIVRRVRVAGSSSTAISLGTNAEPGDWVEVTIKKVTDMERIKELEYRERIMKANAARAITANSTSSYTPPILREKTFSKTDTNDTKVQARGFQGYEDPFSDSKEAINFIDDDAIQVVWGHIFQQHEQLFEADIELS